MSLSERSYGTTISALIMAHELGHNFGAPHDGEAGACAAVGGGFIMAPSVSGYRHVLPVQHRRHAGDAGSGQLRDAGRLRRRQPDRRRRTSVAAEGGVPFTLPFVVRSAGTEAADDVVFTVTLPDNAGVTLDAVSAEGGSCSVSGVTATCNFGAHRRRRAARGQRHRARPGGRQHHRTCARDRQQRPAELQQFARCRRDASAPASTPRSRVEHRRGRGAHRRAAESLLPTCAACARCRCATRCLSLNLNQAVSAASMPGASCTTSQFSVVCTIAELASGSERAAHGGYDHHRRRAAVRRRERERQR